EIADGDVAEAGHAAERRPDRALALLQLGGAKLDLGDPDRDLRILEGDLGDVPGFGELLRAAQRRLRLLERDAGALDRDLLRAPVELDQDLALVDRLAGAKE